MLWLIPVLLSFDIIEALVPVIIILVLIAAAAGLTRGTDIFALFGLGTIMGFANSGSGRVGKGLKGTRYGADSIKRGRAAGKAKNGLVANARKAKAKYGKDKARSIEAKKNLRDRSAKKTEKRLNTLKEKGLEKSPTAKRLQKKLDKINSATKREEKVRGVPDKLVSMPAGLEPKDAVALALGGMAVSRSTRKGLEKTAKHIQKLNERLATARDKEQKGIGEHMSRMSIYSQENERRLNKNLKKGKNTQKTIGNFGDIPTTTRVVSVGREGVRIGHVPKFTNYVKTVNSRSTPVNLHKAPKQKLFLSLGGNTNPGTVGPMKVLKIPKSAFIQKGAIYSIAMAGLQHRWIKQIESGGPHAERAAKRLNKLNEVVAKAHYSDKKDKLSAPEAFELAERGDLRSKYARRHNDIVSFALPIPGGGLVGSLIGRRFHEEKLQRLEHENYLLYLERRKGYDKIKRDMEASKDHTILHPIVGKHGSKSLENKRKKLWLDAYTTASKGIK